MNLQAKKIMGTITHCGVIELCGEKLKPNQLKFKLFNNGFDGEKYESVFSFSCSDKTVPMYEDLSIDIFIDEIEIVRTIKLLKKHLKQNRKEKKVKLNKL